MFEQYLRTTMIPTFEYTIDGDTLSLSLERTSCRASTCRSRVTLDWPTMAVIHPTEAWQSMRVKLPNASDFRVDQNYYVNPKRVDQ